MFTSARGFIMAQISISELSQTISELIDLDTEQQSLITSAIDRAMDARQIVGGKSTRHLPMVNGRIRPAPRPTCDVPILINGIIAVSPYCDPRSNHFPIGKISKPHLDRGLKGF
jgi:hypothetical protein